MKRFLLGLIGIRSMLPVVGLAAPVSFQVTVSPNPMKVSEFADVTVKAIDSNGNVDTSADSDIWLEIKGKDYSDPDIVLPGNGVGFFEASDQGVKIFSKGLSIKKAGTYQLDVIDVYDTSLKGTAMIQVLADSPGPAVGSLTVTSPVSGSIEKLPQVAVIGKTSYANTPLIILVDEVEVQDSMSDQKGDFSLQLAGIQPGLHILEVNALDLEDKVVATSGPIPFTYEPAPTSRFLGLEILPAKEVVIRTKMTFTVTTEETVSSAMLKFGEGDPVPTTKLAPGKFIKEMTFDTPAIYPIDVILTVNQEQKTFNDVETIRILDESRKILTLTATPDPLTNTAGLVWTYTGQIEYFKVKYGTTENNLRLSVTSTKPSTSLLLAEPTMTYYAQVFPVDELGQVNGEPSDVVTILPLKKNEGVCGNAIIEIGETCDDGNLRSDDGCSTQCQLELGAGSDQHPVAAKSCYPEGIGLSTVKVGERYFITRAPVPDAKEYQIYRSDTAAQSIDRMLMIGKTTDTKYEYPFDVTAKVEQYARYAVKAVCPNDDLKPVGDMTKVKVGPEKTIALLIMATVFIFGLVRLQKNYYRG